MIRYYRLFDLLNRNGMKKSDLLQVISAPTIAKLSKGQTVTTEVIDKICVFLGCQPEDIMEVIDDEIVDDERGTKLIIKSNDYADRTIREHLENEFNADNHSVREIIADEEKFNEFIKKLNQLHDKAKKSQ